MDKRIHYSRMLDIMRRFDKAGQPREFSFEYVKKNGERQKYEGCRFTSVHSAGDTVNIIPGGETHPKKFVRILIISLNNHKIYL